MLPKFLTQHMQKAYSKWGLSFNTSTENTTMTKSDLIKLISAAEGRIPDIRCGLVPTSFDPEDSALSGFPRSLSWRWNSCERALRIFSTTSVMARLPLFWQIESPLNAVCKSVGAILFMNEPENMPVGAAAIKSTEIHTVICEARNSFEFALYLSEKNIKPAAWFLIHQSDSLEWSVPLSIDSSRFVAQEVHLFPGLPILEQCALLLDDRKAEFHLSDSYLWEIGKDKTYITSIGDDPLPLVRFEIPFSLISKSQCPCGKVIVERNI